MSYCRLPADFSTWPLVHKIEQKFGLAGFARLVKLLELLGASEQRAAGVVSLPPSDYLEALRCGRQELDALLVYLVAADFLRIEQDGTAGQALAVALVVPGPFVPGSADPALFRRPCEWAAWCASELSFPPEVLTDPYTQQLFRRWCAVNVTTEEMGEAIGAAIEKQSSYSPAALNSALAELRAARLERARR